MRAVEKAKLSIEVEFLILSFLHKFAAENTYTQRTLFRLIMRKSLIVTLLGSLLAVMVTSCGKKETAASAPLSVSVEEATPTEAYLEQHYVGIVEENTSTPVSFVGSGTLQRVCVEEGQAVSKGQLIAELDKTQAESLVAATQAQYDQAQDALQRLRQVHEAGSLPDVKWVEVQSQVAQAKSQLDIAKKNLADCRIYAPVSGVVGSLNFHAGSVVLTSEPIVSILDISTVKVRASIPEREISNLSAQTSTTIHVEAVGRSYEGGRIEKGVSADAITRTYDIRIHVKNADRKLLPGMIADVRMKPAAAAADATTTAAITLPIRCVQQYVGGGNFVWIVEANQAKARKIATGKTFGNRIVVAEGLKGGEKVIVDGWQKVGEGTAVAIR